MWGFFVALVSRGGNFKRDRGERRGKAEPKHGRDELKGRWSIMVRAAAAWTRDDNQDRLAAVPLFSGLSADERCSLARRAGFRRMGRGQPIFLQGDPGDEFFIIMRGQVKIVCETVSGREVTLDMLEAGCFFGEMALLDGEPRSASAVAQSQGELFVLRRTDFQTFLQVTPQAALALLANLSKRLRAADEKIQDLALLTVRERLAAVLTDLALRVGEVLSDGIWLPRDISHKSLASLLGSTRETVSRGCAELRDLGLLSQAGRRLVVVSIDGLKALYSQAGGAKG